MVRIARLSATRADRPRSHTTCRILNNVVAAMSSYRSIDLADMHHHSQSDEIVGRYGRENRRLSRALTELNVYAE
jgi:hypothetical protein